MNALRPKELELMGVFWNTDIPLATAEIKNHVAEYSWSDSSLGALMVRLVKLGFLQVAGTFKKKNIICNTYQAVITKDQYYSDIISKSIGNASSAFVLGFLSNLKESGNIDHDTVDKMRQLLDTWED